MQNSNREVSDSPSGGEEANALVFTETMERARETLGPWSTDNFNSTVQGSLYGLGADAGLGELTRFVGSIGKLIRLRRAQEDAKGDATTLAVFVLDPKRIRSGQFGEGWVAMLNKARAPLCGRIWCVNEIAACGTFLSFDSSSSDEDVFALVMNDAALHALPTIVFDPNESPQQLRLYAAGLRDPGTVHNALLSTTVTLDEIFENFEQTYRHCLMVPAKKVTLWAAASKHWVKEDAETLIQMVLYAGLVDRFPLCIPRAEEPSTSGDYDILLEFVIDPLDPCTVSREAIIELKVLRSFGYNGGPYSASQTIKTLTEGVEQAAAYRTSNKPARKSALCYFDMQKTPVQGLPTSVDALAKKYDVRVRPWRIYNSAKAERKSRIS